jgi:hypothetical protein
MKTKTLIVKIRGGHTGQAIVYVTIAMFFLLAMVAVGVDAGHVYAERRRMQNAADAGALAGASELCFGNPSLWHDKAIEYATTRNGAQAATATKLDYTVTVTATETANMFFAGIIGRPTLHVGAIAAAACGPTTRGCGLWPIGFSTDLWADIKDDCGEVFDIWTGDKDEFLPNCDLCDCSGIITDVGRAWLDFTDAVDPMYPDSCGESTGCGTNELKCWVVDDSDTPIIIPACIPGDTGVKAGVKNEIEERAEATPPGNVVRIPLFDGTCERAPKDNCSGGFNVVSFGCVEAVAWEQNYTLPYKATPTPDPLNTPTPVPPGGNPANCWKGHVVKVAVHCGKDCYSKCGTTVGSTPVPGGVNAVSLIR